MVSSDIALGESRGGQPEEGLEVEVELDVEAEPDLGAAEPEPEAAPAGEPRAGTAAAGGAADPSLLSASLGVTEDQPADDWEELLRRAGDALSRAKRAGRNRTAVA
jgi:GGDEF domain-containing protein